MTRRRRQLSARTPANTDRMNAGSVDEACTSATIRSEGEIVAISQLMATVCINQPRLETCVASQIERKVRLVSGANVAGETTSESAPAAPLIPAFCLSSRSSCPGCREQHARRLSHLANASSVSTPAAPPHTLSRIRRSVPYHANLPIRHNKPFELKSTGRIFFCIAARLRYVLVNAKPLIVRS